MLFLLPLFFFRGDVKLFRCRESTKKKKKTRKTVSRKKAKKKKETIKEAERKQKLEGKKAEF